MTNNNINEIKLINLLINNNSKLKKNEKFKLFLLSQVKCYVILLT